MTGVMDQADLLSVVPVSSSAPMGSTGLSSAPNISVDQVQQVAKQTGVKNSSTTTSNTVGGSMCDEKTVEYLRDLIEEKKTIENNNNKDENAPKSIVLRLLDQEIARIQSGGKPPGRDSKFVDIYHEKPIRLTVRALVPVKEHPKFNFVGKLLGPKGNSMKRLQEETMTKMAVLGRGSMRNKQQEEELRKSSDPKYQHLNDDLHVEITAFAPPSEAHARIAYALTEVRKYLIPDSNDEIRQEQMREMELLNSAKPVSNSDGQDDLDGLGVEDHADTASNSSLQGSGTPSPPSSTVIAMRGLNNSSNKILSSRRLHLASSSEARGQTVQMPSNGRSSGSKYLRGHLLASAASGGSGTSGGPSGGGNSQQQPQAGIPRPNTSKVRVLSILDKIRSSTQENYSTNPTSNSGGSCRPSVVAAQTNNESLIDAISLVEDNGFTFEEYEGSSTVGIKGVKSTAMDRGYRRMHIAPYVRPK